jgi:hypothetical protein
MKQIIIIITICFYSVGCSKQSSHNANPKNDSTNEKIDSTEFIHWSAYCQADSAAKIGQPWAFQKLYDIAENDDCAECSEEALISLTELLYYKTERWINAFSQLPDSAQSVFKKSQYWAYIGEVDFQNDSTMTQKHFREVVMNNLRNIHSNSRQRELADYFTNLFQTAIIEDSLKNK